MGHCPAGFTPDRHRGTSMRHLGSFRALALAGIGLGAVGAFVSAQSTTGPVARYEMRAGTTSGFAGMASGGKPSMGSALGMAMGRGGNSAQHELWLDLGSSRAQIGRAHV